MEVARRVRRRRVAVEHGERVVVERLHLPADGNVEPQAEGVDGDLLLSLTVDDLKNDLGLSGIHAKKVLHNVEFSKNLCAAAEGGGEDVEKLREELKAALGEGGELKAKVEALTDDTTSLEEKLQALEEATKAKDAEIEELKKKMEGMEVKAKAAPAPAPAPPPAPAPVPRRGIRGRRRGRFRLAGQRRSDLRIERGLAHAPRVALRCWSSRMGPREEPHYFR